MDRSKDKIGYEINFTKYFYKFKSLRSVDEIKQELLEINLDKKEINKEFF